MDKRMDTSTMDTSGKTGKVERKKKRKEKISQELFAAAAAVVLLNVLGCRLTY